MTAKQQPWTPGPWQDWQVSLVPMTLSPVIRNMWRQTHRFQATNRQTAEGYVRHAFSGGVDLSGEWFVERDSLRQIEGTL